MRDEHKLQLSRRTFGGAVAGAAVAVPLAAQQQPAAAPNPNTSVQQQQQRRTGPPPEVEPFAGPIEFTRKAASTKARPFDMTQVRVTGGIYKEGKNGIVAT
jgi:hypothetical protein